MSKPCRLIHAHHHQTIPASASFVAALARANTPPGMTLLRVRWLDDAREWQVCYAVKEAT